MPKTYIDAINKKTLGNPIFYITNKLDRAIGVEELLANYHIITAKESYLSSLLLDRGAHVLSLPIDADIHVKTIDLLKSPQVKDYIFKNTRTRANVMFFQANKAIYKQVADQYNILNADPVIAFNIEHKIKQYEILSDAQLHNYLPKAVMRRIHEASYTDISKLLGPEFVMQQDIGQSGNSTYFIRSEKEFDEFFDKHHVSKIMMKFTELLDGEYYTINAVATHHGTYIGGLCNQITGLTQIQAGPGETCGNNWNQVGITQEMRETMVDLTEKIGKHIYKMGFKGMFGVDFVYHNDQCYILEINARQTASTQNLSKLQIEAGDIPLFIIHLLELLDIDFAINKDEYNQKNSYPFEASCIIIRNHSQKQLQIQKGYNGLYTIENMQFDEDGYSFMDIYSLSKALVIETPEKELVEPGDYFLKILTKGDVMQDSHTIDANIMHMIETIKQGTKEHE